ncbi:hypothetical protein BGX20_010609, partial [Mortierella sp. AD010]
MSDTRSLLVNVLVASLQACLQGRIDQNTVDKILSLNKELENESVLPRIQSRRSPLDTSVPSTPEEIQESNPTPELPGSMQQNLVIDQLDFPNSEGLDPHENQFVNEHFENDCPKE